MSATMPTAPEEPSQASNVALPQRCDRCHRRISDPHSRALGLGPVCRGKV